VTIGGLPRAGCKVVFGTSLEALNRGLAAPEQSSEAAITDASGKYSFEGVTAGEYLIAVPGCGVLLTTTRVTISRDQQASVDVSC
jgi:hypothetical protein